MIWEDRKKDFFASAAARAERARMNIGRAFRKMPAVAIPPDHNFSFLALENASVADDLVLPMDLGDGFIAVQEVPIVFDDGLREKLGTLRQEQLSRSNLVLVAVEPIGSGREVWHRLTQLWLGLLLQGAPNYEEGRVVGGTRGSGTPTILNVRDQRPHYPMLAGLPYVITAQTLRNAALAASGLAKCFADLSIYRRFRRGFQAWWRGILDDELDFRLHQFVRALEGVAFNSDRDQFKSRIGAFTMETDQDTLATLYKLRNMAEHLNEFEKALSDTPPDRRAAVAGLHAHRAEVLASAVLNRILQSDDLLTIVVDEQSLTSFWSSSAEARARRFGDPVDVVQAASRNFLDDANV